MDEVKGSNPLCSTMDLLGLICYTFFVLGRLAQLARASRLHREGRGFESLSAHQIKNPPQGGFLIGVRNL
jgi:hypothetical protein